MSWSGWQAQELNAQLAQRPLPEGHYAEWRAELEGVNAEFPLSYPHRDDVIMPQHAIEVSCLHHSQHTERSVFRGAYPTVTYVYVSCSFAPPKQGQVANASVAARVPVVAWESSGFL